MSCPDVPAYRTRSLGRWAALAIICAAIAVYGHTLGGYFVADDFGYVSLFAQFPIQRWPHLFVQEWSQGIWGFRQSELRPIPALVFILDALLWRGWAGGYRLTNLLLHVTCSYLVFAVGLRMLRLPQALALVAALLFAVHPSHVAPVVWITGRVDLLPTFFCLGGLLAFARFRETRQLLVLVVSYSCYFCAVFSKEYGLVLPILVLAYDISRRGSTTGCATSRSSRIVRCAAPYCGYLVVAAIYYVCREAAFAAAANPPPARGFDHVVVQQLQYWRYLLAVDDATNDIVSSWRPSASPALLRAVAGSILLIVALPFVWRAFMRRGLGFFPLRLLFVGPAWFLISTLPFIVTYTSARHLYLASAGFCLFLASLATTVTRTSARQFTYFFVAALIAIWGHDAYVRTLPWKRAALLTKRVVPKLRELADAPPRTVLVTQLPDHHDGVYAFAWSSPFVFDRPFLKKSLRKRLIVIEMPDTYYSPARWNQKPEIWKLAHLTGEIVAFSLSLDPASQQAKLRPIDGERVRKAGKSLNLQVQQNPTQEPMLLWEQFRSAL